MKTACARACLKNAAILRIAFFIGTIAFGQDVSGFRPEIPPFWNEAEILAMELPRVRLTEPPSITPLSIDNT
jgi:hypothetical protein